MTRCAREYNNSKNIRAKDDLWHFRHMLYYTLCMKALKLDGCLTNQGV